MYVYIILCYTCEKSDYRSEIYRYMTYMNFANSPPAQLPSADTHTYQHNLALLLIPNTDNSISTDVDLLVGMIKSINNECDTIYISYTFDEMIFDGLIISTETAFDGARLLYMKIGSKRFWLATMSHILAISCQSCWCDWCLHTEFIQLAYFLFKRDMWHILCNWLTSLARRRIESGNYVLAAFCRRHLYQCMYSHFEWNRNAMMFPVATVRCGYRRKFPNNCILIAVCVSRFKLDCVFLSHHRQTYLIVWCGISDNVWWW